jgi:hypothetical protein
MFSNHSALLFSNGGSSSCENMQASLRLSARGHLQQVAALLHSCWALHCTGSVVLCMAKHRS